LITQDIYFQIVVIYHGTYPAVSCTVFTSKNVTEMSQTILKKRKSEVGIWKTSLAQPRFRLPISHLSDLASARQVSAFT